MRNEEDGWLIVPFPDQESFERWLDAHHEAEPGLWVKFARKGTGIASLTLPEAVEIAACFGWVDSKMRKFDDNHYVLRFQPRRPKSNWAASSKGLAERLIAQGRMRPSGLAQVTAAKADGRWSAG